MGPVRDQFNAALAGIAIPSKADDRGCNGNGSSYDVAMASSLTTTQSQHINSSQLMSSSLKADHNAADDSMSDGAANKTVAEGFYSHEVCSLDEQHPLTRNSN